MSIAVIQSIELILERINHITRSSMEIGVSKRREYKKELTILRDFILGNCPITIRVYNAAQSFDYKYNTSCIRLIEEAEDFVKWWKE